MQSQPGTNPALIRAESMRFASSELLKIETALVQNQAPAHFAMRSRLVLQPYFALRAS